MSEEKKKINIELPESIADGQYVNISIITHSAQEFILDFVRMVPGLKSGKVKSRVIMNPQNAKQLAKILTDNVRRYESTNGVINDPRTDNTNIPSINFGGPPKDV